MFVFIFLVLLLCSHTAIKGTSVTFSIYIRTHLLIFAFQCVSFYYDNLKSQSNDIMQHNFMLILVIVLITSILNHNVYCGLYKNFPRANVVSSKTMQYCLVGF